MRNSTVYLLKRKNTERGKRHISVNLVGYSSGQVKEPLRSD